MIPRVSPLVAIVVASCSAPTPTVVIGGPPVSNGDRAPAQLPATSGFRLANPPATSPVRWLGPFPGVVRLPDAAAITTDGRLVSLADPEDEVRSHVLFVPPPDSDAWYPVGGAWFSSRTAVSLLTPAGLQHVRAIPKRGRFLRAPESGMDWRGQSPFGVFGADDGGPAFLGDCATGDFGSACMRTSRGTWRSVRFHPGLERMRDRWWSFAVVPAGERLYVLERQDEPCIASSGAGPRRPCRQLFFLHDAERGVLRKYSDVPLWAYQGSNSFMNAHGFHVGQGGALRMWPVDKDDGGLGDPKSGEKCSIDFLPDGATSVACRPGRLATAGSCALSIPPDSVTLQETCDAGTTWRAVKAPAPMTAATSLGCEALGCYVGDRIRLGWCER